MADVGHWTSDDEEVHLQLGVGGEGEDEEEEEPGIDEEWLGTALLSIDSVGKYCRLSKHSNRVRLGSAGLMSDVYVKQIHHATYNSDLQHKDIVTTIDVYFVKDKRRAGVSTGRLAVVFEWLVKPHSGRSKQVSVHNVLIGPADDMLRFMLESNGEELLDGSLPEGIVWSVEHPKIIWQFGADWSDLWLVIREGFADDVDELFQGSMPASVD